MSAFTPLELAYLASQPIGRIATMQSDGTLQASPVGFSYNPHLDTIDVGGYGMARSRKYRNVGSNDRVAFVVDDLAPDAPHLPRCVEIRGNAEAIDDAQGGPLIRIHAKRIIAFGIDAPFTSPATLVVNSRDVR